MRDGIGLFPAGDLHHPLGNERARDARAQKILVLVNRRGLHHRENKIPRELLPQIIDIDLGRAGCARLLFEALEFFLLADVGAESDHFRLIFLPQPRKENRGVESPRVSQDDFHSRIHTQRANQTPNRPARKEDSGNRQRRDRKSAFGNEP